jgi:hypothetical protein
METQKCVIVDIHVTGNNITPLSADKGKPNMGSLWIVVKLQNI